MTDLLDTVNFISAMDHSILDIPRLPLQSVRRLNTLFPRFEKKDLEFDLTASQSDRIIVWFFRPHDRRRYALTLGWNGFLRLRQYNSDDTRYTVFESQHQDPEDFDDLLNAFSKCETDWHGYALELHPGVWI